MSTWRPDTQAVVADTARIYSKDLNVEAGNELVSVTLGASGGQAKTVAVNGVVLVNVTSATTVAQVARGATVAATGTASIQARDATCRHGGRRRRRLPDRGRGHERGHQ